MKPVCYQTKVHILTQRDTSTLWQDGCWSLSFQELGHIYMNDIGSKVGFTNFVTKEERELFSLCKMNMFIFGTSSRFLGNWLKITCFSRIVVL